MVGVATTSSAKINKKVYDFTEDEVDMALYKIDGRIKRQRDPKLYDPRDFFDCFESYLISLPVSPFQLPPQLEWMLRPLLANRAVGRGVLKEAQAEAPLLPLVH